MRRATDWPIAGRDDELAVITNLLADKTSGGFVIVGAAGVGKTRLAQETLRLARRAGMPTASLAGSRSAAIVPLGVFAPLLPAIHGTAGTLTDLRWAANVLSERESGRRLVLAVDDAHLLDLASAALLHQVTLDASTFVAVTLRCGEPAPDAVLALWKDGLVTRIELEELDRDQTADLLRQLLGGPIELATADQLWATTAGSPMYLREYVLAATESGTLIEHDGAWRLVAPLTTPPSVHDLAQHQLGMLRPVDRAVLNTLAAGPVGGAELSQRHPYADLTALLSRRLIRHTRDGALDTPLAAILRSGGVGRGSPLPGDQRPSHLIELAEQAYRAADFDGAELLARAACAADPRSDGSLLLAQLLDERGEHTEAEDLLATVSLTTLPPDQRVRAALARADNLFFGLSRAADAQQVHRLAMESFAGDQTGELVANSAWFDVHAGRPLAALERLAPNHASDIPGTVAKGIVRSWALSLTGATKAALLAAEEAAALENPSRRRQVSRHADFPALARGVALTAAGQLVEADYVARVGLDASRADRPDFLHARWATLCAEIAAERGRVATAAAAFGAAATIQRAIDQPGLLRANLAGLAVAASQHGAMEEAAQALSELDDLPDVAEQLFDPDVLAARAWHAVAGGELSTAVRLLQDAAELARQKGLVTVEARMLHDVVRLDGAIVQANRLNQLAEQSDSSAVGARAEHARAVVNGSGDTLRHAADRLEQQGMCLLAAEALTQAAAAYRRTERRQARACAQRAAALVEQCEGATTPALRAAAQPASLTQREREVVTMAAAGLPNRVIAERLVISIRTVENLLHRAYVKLGAGNRSEAAEALGLPPSAPRRD